MYIYDNFVVNTTDMGNFKVEMHADDEYAKTTIIISRKEIEGLVNNSNVDCEMIAILIAIIRYQRAYAFKNDGQDTTKDITLTETFKTKMLVVLENYSIEYLIEIFKDMKYSSVMGIFYRPTAELLDYLK